MNQTGSQQTCSISALVWDDSINWTIESYPQLVDPATQAQPQLAVSPTSYDFRSITQGDTPARAFSVVNDGTGTLSASVVSWPPWVDVTGDIAISSFGTFVAKVKANAPPGNLSGSIQVSSNGGNRSIPVAVQVQAPPPQPIIAASLTSHDFGTVGQGSTPWVDVQVSNAGTGVLQWSYASGPQWVEVTTPGDPTVGAGTMTVALRDTAPVGVLNGTILLLSNGGSAQVTVTANVQDTEKPTINDLRMPGGSANRFKTAREYTIIFDVSDNVGTESIDLFYLVDGEVNWNPIVSNFVIGSNGINWGYEWAILPDTPLTNNAIVKLVARDTSGNESEAESAPFSIIDGSAPGVTVLSPSGGEVWDLQSQHDISWTATSPNGIQVVRLYVHYGDTVSFIERVTDGSSSYNWTLPVSAGFVTNSARIRLRVTDGNGNDAEAWSDGYFTINDPSQPPPPPWTTPAQITAGGSNWAHTGTAPDGTPHIVYGGTEAGPTPTDGVWHRTFDGTSWSSADLVYEVTPQTDADLIPSYGSLRLAVDQDGNPHVVWHTATSSNMTEVFYTRHEDSSWTIPENLSNNSRVADFSWTPKASLPQPNVPGAAAVVSDKIYVLGGSPTLRNEVYDFSTNTWSQRAPLPNSGVDDEGGAAVVNGKVYVVGGPSDYEVMIYNPATDTWSTGADMPTPRRGIGVAAVNGKVYAIGGYQGNETVNEIYDPSTNSWSPLSDMPTGRGFASVLAVDGLIYVMGGVTPSGLTRTVEVYDPATDSWSSRADMLTPRRSSAVGVINGLIYLVGGYDYSPDNLADDVDVYHPLTDQWIALNPIAVARAGAAGAVVNGKFYLIGGANEYGEELALVEEGALQGVADPNPTASQDPRVVVNMNGDVQVIWSDGFSYSSGVPRTLIGTSTLFHRTRNNASGAWSATAQVIAASSPEIAVDGADNIHVILEKSDEIRHVRYDGTNWSTMPDIVVADGSNFAPDIAAGNEQELHVVWQNSIDEGGGLFQRIMYKRFDGTSWSPAEEVSDRIADVSAILPSISVDPSGVPHVIWVEAGNSTRRAVVHKQRGPGGWSTRIKINLDSQNPRQDSSSLTVSNDGHAYATWADLAGGQHEIFYNVADLSMDTTPPTVAFDAPQGGESLSIGSTYTVQWTAQDNVGIDSVSLAYTDDDGSSFTNIPTNGSVSGSFNWTAPSITSDTVQLQVSVSDAAGITASALSGMFAITDLTSPSVSVVSPNGGETWQAGSQHEINYTASDNVGVTSVDVLLSVDSGLSWKTLSTQQANAGVHSWTTPDTPGSTFRIKVVALDAAGNGGQDESDSSFALVNGNSPPYQPENPTPSDASLHVPLDPALTWDGADPDLGDSVTYDVYFGTSVNPPLVSNNQTSTSFSPNLLQPGVTYFWKIEADDGQATAAGDTWSFTSGQHEIMVTAGPSSTVNLATPGEPVGLSVEAIDTQGYELSYLWSSWCPGLPSSGTIGPLPSDTAQWTPPDNPTGEQQQCLIGVYDIPRYRAFSIRNEDGRVENAKSFPFHRTVLAETNWGRVPPRPSERLHSFLAVYFYLVQLTELQAYPISGALINSSVPALRHLVRPGFGGCGAAKVFSRSLLRLSIAERVEQEHGQHKDSYSKTSRHDCH